MADKTTQLAKHLKPGGFVIINNIPCKVDKVNVSSSGKHGHAKVRLDAIGILDGIRKSVIKTAHDNIEVPIILRKKGQVVSLIGNNKAQIMDMENFEVMEMEIPEDRKEEIIPGSDIEFFEVLNYQTLKKLK